MGKVKTKGTKYQFSVAPNYMHYVNVLKEIKHIMYSSIPTWLYFVFHPLSDLHDKYTHMYT